MRKACRARPLTPRVILAVLSILGLHVAAGCSRTSEITGDFQWAEPTSSGLVWIGEGGKFVRWNRNSGRTRTVGSCSGTITGQSVVGDSVSWSCIRNDQTFDGVVLQSANFDSDAVEVRALDPAWWPGPGVCCGTDDFFLVVMSNGTNGDWNVWWVPSSGEPTVSLKRAGTYEGVVSSGSTVFLLSDSNIYRADYPSSTLALEYTGGTDGPLVDGFALARKGTLWFTKPLDGTLWSHTIGQTGAVRVAVEPVSQQAGTGTAFQLGGFAIDDKYVYWVVTFAASGASGSTARNTGSALRRAPLAGGAVETLVASADPDDLFTVMVDDEFVYWSHGNALMCSRK